MYFSPPSRKNQEDYPNAKIYIHELDREWLYDIRVNNSFMRVISEAFIIEADVSPLVYGDYVFSGKRVRVIHSPGHSPGSVLYYFEDDRLLFVGDTVAFRRIPRYNLLNSDSPELFESLLRLKRLNIPDDTAVLFGHGERTSYGEMIRDFECFRKSITVCIKDTMLEDSYIEGDTFMLSINEVAKILGTSYFLIGSKSAVMYLPDMSRLKVNADSSDAEIEDFTVNMKNPARFKYGKMYIPAKFIAQICKSFIEWSLTVK